MAIGSSQCSAEPTANANRINLFSRLLQINAGRGLHHFDGPKQI